MRNNQRVVIVGGGFSGVALAVALLRANRAGLHVTLIEATASVGRGVAYGTAHASHLLNTRATQMSLHTDDPEHFLRFCRERGADVHGDDFLPRRDYGDYLEGAFAAACRDGSRTALEVRLQTRVVDIERAGGALTLTIENGGHLEADAVVMATGHGAPADPLRGVVAPDERRYVRDPWAADALARIGARDRVLVLGTGLTAVDVAFALADRGHEGCVSLVSRHGLLPQQHAPVRQVLPRDVRSRLLAGFARNDLRAMVRELRGVGAAVAARGQSWHAVFDALRPYTARIWAELCAEDRRRFLRWLRPYWDTHRHRLSPLAARRVATLRAAGRLTIAAGRVASVAPAPRGLAIGLRLRGANRCVVEPFDWIVNCTGNTCGREDRRPLERALLERGLLLGDPLGLGYATSDNGVAIGRHGPVAGLYVLGPGCRPNWWEHTAVPELRSQAAALAAELTTSSQGTPWLAAAPQREASSVPRWHTHR